MPAMSLLTPSESIQFQSFLSSMDYNDHVVAPEWSMYSSSNFGNISIPHAQGVEAMQLSKATKELMSLDPDRWHSGRLEAQMQMQMHHHPADHHWRGQAYHPQSQQQLLHPMHNNDYHRLYTNSLPVRQNTPLEQFPILKRPPYYAGQHSHHHLPQQLQHPHQHHQPPTPLQTPPTIPLRRHHSYQHSYPQHSGYNSVSPRHTFSSASSRDGPTPSSSSASASPPPSSATSTYSNSNFGASVAPLRSPTPPSSSKRSISQTAELPSSQPPPKRSRSTGSASQKPTLLSPSQKKANHIQSEQKRRANIRRGYEALCEGVPALREAIREEESGSAGGDEASKSRSRRSKANKAKSDDNSEKADGRAGPRSENVVLSKTIEYIEELLAEREALTTRLESARALVPADHPSLVCPDPLWEREWKGGEDRADVDVDGDADGEEGDEETS